MSFTASYTSKNDRRACEACRERKARFQYRGVVKADRHHTLCFECFRRERERQRARGLLDLGDSATATVNASGLTERPASLTARQVAHRRTLLAALQARGTRRA